MSLYRLATLTANDSEDMVHIIVGDLKPVVAYQTSFEIAHALRLACKGAARHDRAPASFWLAMDIADLNDCPRPHRGFRRSNQTQNVTNWSVRYKGAEVALIFDEHVEVVGYEDGIKLHQRIRTAGRRAKAWAGDTGRQTALLANLTSAEDDYRIGLG